VQCVVTSPPYWGLRDYGVEGQIGLEATPEQYVQTLVAVFREVRRVLRDDGTLWLNMGDSYASSGIDTRGAYSTKSTLDKGRWSPASGRQYDEQKNPVTTVKTIPPGLKPKDLIGIPWRVAFALQADGWYLRSDIVWAKGVSFCPDYSGSVMPESVTDRPTKGHEYLFLLSKQPRYYYDAEAVRETARYPDGANAPDKVASPYGQGFTANRSTGASSGGRNLRSVWAINPQPYSEAHFATFPTALVEPCVKAGTSEKGACDKCGAPWNRQTDISYSPGDGGPGFAARHTDHRDRGRPNLENKKKHVSTSGWAPSCKCETDSHARCVVLDPFAGSGTVGCVALKLGREFVGIELNPDYCTLARESIEGPLFARSGGA
jgi:DNA modification methylase